MRKMSSIHLLMFKFGTMLAYGGYMTSKVLDCLYDPGVKGQVQI